MTDTAFTTRLTTCTHNEKKIAKLVLPTNKNRQYQHDEVVTFINGVKRMLLSTYCLDENMGMLPLLISITNAINMSVISAIKGAQSTTAM